MEIEMQVDLSLEQALRRLESAVASGRSRGQRLKPRLDGEVSADRVVLYRRRGLSTWYGTFRGSFHGDGSRLMLTGKFVRSSGVFMTVWAGLAILWGLFLAGAVIVQWQIPDSLLWLGAAAIAIAIGTATFWFRAKNARAEADLLRVEIAEILGSHGA